MSLTNSLLCSLALTVVLLFEDVQSLSGKCNSYEREKVNEGYFRCVYKDPRGIPTIGVGFNLKKSGARMRITNIGANYKKILRKTECLTDSQIKDLFDDDMAEAVQCARSWLSKVWSILGSTRQSVIADMAFNLGCSRLKQFKRMKAAIEEQDYTKAAAEMRNSLWCRQVKTRCDRDIKCMQSRSTTSRHQFWRSRFTWAY